MPKESKHVFVGNNASLEVKGLGTCKLVLRGGCSLLLHDVLFVPGIRRNLLSIVSLLNVGYVFVFEDNAVHIFHNSILYGSGFLDNGCLIMDHELPRSNLSFDSCFAISSLNVDISVWHRRLGHIGLKHINRLAKEGLLGQT